MSQHALKLAEALAQAAMELDETTIILGNRPVASIFRAAVQRARTTYANYLASDEYREDVASACASALGFQGLAGKPNPK